MGKYTIVITEMLKKSINIEAENYVDALDKVENMYREGKIILSADDFDEVKFE